MGALLTGSRVYGTPRDDSDIDLVVLVTPEEIATLCDAAGVSMLDGCGELVESRPLRFGNLNLIATSSREAFRVWEEGTAYLQRQAVMFGGQTREVAVAEFKQRRKEAGVS